MGATDADPFAIFHLPPPNETAGERAARETMEAAAKKRSQEIDDELKRERAEMKKQKSIVRVLLLGQSESGKSTTLKNFRMRYAKDAWDAERASWRSVIQLNLIRSIITIVETLQAEMDGEPLDVDQPNTPITPATPNTAVPGNGNSDMGFHYDPLSSYGASPTVITSFNVTHRSSGLDSPSVLSRSNSISRSMGPGTLSSLLTSKHQILKMRLGPLRRVEADLKKRLGAGADEELDGMAQTLGPLGTETDTQALMKRPRREFSVRKLKEALESGAAAAAIQSSSRSGSVHGHGAVEEERSGEELSSSPGVDEATEVIASCKEDMQALWADEAVRVVLKKRKIRMEDSAGFFLDDLNRIANRDYEPSDDDVVRARLRTLGVQEYKVHFESSSSTIFSNGIGGGDFGKEWILYDVGGSRTMRHAWLPFFDNVQAIIFLAPVSCFDERLSEDSKINRLEDSFLLWRTIVSSPLLAKATMILFLNKCDLLKKKLKAGVKVRHYLPSFGERSNDASTVVKYLREKFKEILKQHSPEQRVSYFHATSVTDTKATASTIKAVKDSIIRDYLKSADFV
ncbi:guanine nucleotide binding protein, alpha subunit [Crassisporium funariophilum]|nr:guanine nucleotide binding protein, alpha subunit [Crassisporium funariophilum]